MHQAERVGTADGYHHFDLVFDTLAAGKRFRSSRAGEVRNLGREEVPRIGPDKHRATVIVVDVGALGIGADRQGVNPRFKHDQRDGFVGELVVITFGPGDALEKVAVKSPHRIPVGVYGVNREGVFFKADIVGEVNPAGFGSRQGDVGDEDAAGVRQDAVDLARGAEVTVGDGHVNGGLRGADHKARVADGVGSQGGTGWQGDGGVDSGGQAGKDHRPGDVFD